MTDQRDQAAIWRTMADDEVRPAGYWESLDFWCPCAPFSSANRDQPVGALGVVRIDPESDAPGTCQRCGRSYRLVIQVREPA